MVKQQEQVRKHGFPGKVCKKRYPRTGSKHGFPGTSSQEQVPRFPARVPKQKFSGTGPVLKYDMITGTTEVGAYPVLGLSVFISFYGAKICHVIHQIFGSLDTSDTVSDNFFSEYLSVYS